VDITQIRLDSLLATVCHVSLRTADGGLGSLPSDTTRKCTHNTAGTTDVQLIPFRGHAVAQAVSRWLPTAVARVRVRAACGICGGQSGTGAGFLRVLRFPLPIIPPISPSSSLSPGDGTIGLLVAAVPSGPWIPPPTIPI
jgi:hypothetical protein